MRINNYYVPNKLKAAVLPILKNNPYILEDEVINGLKHLIQNHLIVDGKLCNEC